MCAHIWVWGQRSEDKLKYHLHKCHLLPLRAGAFTGPEVTMWAKLAPAARNRGTDPSPFRSLGFWCLRASRILPELNLSAISSSALIISSETQLLCYFLCHLKVHWAGLHGFGQGVENILKRTECIFKKKQKTSQMKRKSRSNYSFWATSIS